MESSLNNALDQVETVEELKQKVQGSKDEIVFTNNGEMVVNNRSYRRNFKNLWKSVEENQKSVRYYTIKHKTKTSTKKKRKQERKNKKQGRK